MKKTTKKELKEDKLVKSVFNLIVYIQEHSTISMVVAGVIIVAVALVWGLNYSNKKANEKALERLGIAQLSFRQGAFGEAKDTLQSIIDHYKRTKAAYLASYYLGYINLLEENYDKALSNYEYFLGSNIKDRDLKASAMYGLGVAYEGKGETARAIEMYERLLAEYTGYFNEEEVLLALARAYKAKGDTTKALFYYETCLKKYPDSIRKEDIKENIIELSLRREDAGTEKR